MPVRIDKLGAHLEAYIQTLPTIIALRLCGRFGTGPQCHINKLPVELLSAIEKFVVEAARMKALKSWASEYKCFEVRCDLIDDHFTRKEQHDMYHEAMNEDCCRGSRCRFQDNIDAETTAMHRKVLVKHVEAVSASWALSSFWLDPHDTKIRAWVKIVDTARSDCIFNEHREFVRNHFGIDIWISNFPLPSLSNPPAGEEWKRGESQNTTMAYMTLPENASSRVDRRRSWYDHGKLQSGYAMPVKVGAVPTEASLRRFPRAMNILGLDVFIHPTQKGTVISAPPGVQSSGVTGAVDESVADWPQLTLLTKYRIEE